MEVGDLRRAEVGSMESTLAKLISRVFLSGGDRVQCSETLEEGNLLRFA